MLDTEEPDAGAAPDNSNMPQNEPANNTSQSDWEGFSEDDKKYIGDKGWKASSDMLKSYRELEKSYGTKISIPKDEDTEGWNKLYNKLGRPESADKYEFEADEGIKNQVQETFFKAGLSDRQSKEIVEWYNKTALAQKEMADKAIEEQSKKEKDEVFAEWGENKEKNAQLMERGAKLISDNEEDWSKVELALGTKKFMQVMKQLGEAISEDSLPTESKGKSKTPMSNIEYITKVFEGEV